MLLARTDESYPTHCGSLYNIFALNLVVRGFYDPQNNPDQCTIGYNPLTTQLLYTSYFVTLVSVNALVTP